MASILTTVGRWFGWGGALGENTGQQTGLPSGQLIPGTVVIASDGALQIDAVWACIDRRANLIASLPFFAYKEKDGEKVLARTTRLYALLSDSPNSRMTPFEFWRAMMVNYDLRGNAYARIDRDTPAEGQNLGEATALWPMPADQVRAVVLDNGSMVYEYMVGGTTVVLGEESVLHLKNLGNGTVGLSKLDYMASTTDEVAKAQGSAAKVFGNSGKPTAILMIDSALTKEQREGLRANYGELTSGSTARLAVLEANMKYQQLSLSPTDQQLLETRRYGVEQICRWFDVPAVLVNHPGVVQYGNHDIIEGIFYKLSIAPMLQNIEQAFRKRVMTPRQRASMVCEFQMDALLRGSASQRAEMYAKGLQNGWITRAEVRQLEGWPYMEGTNVLTAQSNLLPLDKLGQVKPVASGGDGADIAQ
ncbi:MAG: phage portal protein [Hyphomicrobiales bacterium]|nr:MAG: phage portal protein [Hyphomicrobiales bacterium]